MKRSPIRKMCELSLLLTLSLMLSYLESLLPILISIPGAKLGLANLTIVFILYRYGEREALVVNILRILLISILFTNFYSFLYSLGGALCSFVVMVLAKKGFGLHTLTVSALGGVFHNLGQLIVAALVMKTFTIAVTLPYLVGIGLLTGILIGVLATIILEKTNDFFFKRNGI